MTPHIGPGFGGLGTAIQLSRAGRHDYVVGRQERLGGTWRDNSYPGCACDVPSHLYSYSYSFAGNPDWSNTYSGQAEIWAYLEDCADRFAVRSRLRQGCAVTAARWDHSRDLTGARVAVIGTGASAIQFVPAIAPTVARLTLFQRPPAWVIPRSARPITRVERGAYRHVPFARRLNRALIYWAREAMAFGFLHPGFNRRVAQALAQAHLRRQVPDPVLRRTPVTGVDGQTLARAWTPSMTAHRGTMVAGFPNLFVLLGPNTGLGHTSVVLMAESQIRHLMNVPDHQRRHGIDALAPTEEAQRRWSALVDERMRDTVWVSGGCSSWYLDATGRNSTIWPGYATGFRLRLRRFHPDEYVVPSRSWVGVGVTA